MASEEILRRTLHNADRKPFAKLKNIEGSFVTEGFELFIDEVQGDRTGHTRMRVRVPMKRAAFPDDTYSNESRRNALRDIIARRFWESARTHARSPIPKTDGGEIYIPRPGQEILSRGSVAVTEHYVEARFTADLPSKANKVDEAAMIDLIFGRISLIVSESMLFSAYKRQKLYVHLETAENADWIRDNLESKGLAAFVAVGSVLPRREDDLAPMIDAFPFDCEDRLKVTMDVPNGEPIVGMGIKKGFTIITGPTASGKTSFVDALFSGVYDHIPGDGREYMITSPDAVYVMSEPGRACGERTLSGPESEMEAVAEAIEAGSKLILLDEEFSSPCVIRRAFPPAEGDMRSLSEMAHALGEDGVSVLMVSGDEPAVKLADSVLVMNDFRIRSLDVDRLTSESRFDDIRTRYPVARGVSFEKGRKDVSTSAPSVRMVEIGEYKISVPVAGFFDQGQTREVAEAIGVAKDMMDGSISLKEVCERAIQCVEESEYAMECAHARPIDMAMVLSRHPQMIFIKKRSAPVVAVRVLPMIEHLVGVIRHMDLVRLAVRDDEPLDRILFIAMGATYVRTVLAGPGARLACDGSGLEKAELLSAVGAQIAPGRDLEVPVDPCCPLLGGEPHGRGRRQRGVVRRSILSVPIAHIIHPSQRLRPLSAWNHLCTAQAACLLRLCPRLRRARPSPPPGCGCRRL